MSAATMPPKPAAGPRPGTVDDAWLRSVAAVTDPHEQVRAVALELKRRHPRFDGVLNPEIDDGKVVGVKLVTNHVTDLAPLRALQGLRTVFYNGVGPENSRMSDLAPLKGLALTTLHCAGTDVSDLSPLRGMPLTMLDCSYTRVADLTPLEDSPLTYLQCGVTQVHDLTPVRGKALTFLDCRDTQVADLTPLE